jgi:hypothetical protein
MKLTKKQINTLLRDYKDSKIELDYIMDGTDNEDEISNTFEYGYVRGLESLFCTLKIDYRNLILTQPS